MSFNSFLNTTKALLDKGLNYFNLTLDGIACIFKKELTQLFRDKYLMMFIIGLPMVQLLVTGLAVQRDMRHIPTLVYNYDRHNASVELLKSLENSTYFTVKADPRVGSEADLISAVRTGKYRLGLIIPPDYSANLLTGQQSPKVNLVLDGTNANVSKTILDALQAIFAEHSARTLSQQAGSLNQGSNHFATQINEGIPTKPFELKTKIINNPELSPSVFLIPGILGIIMHMLTVILSSFSIVREREAGTLEQLMVSPIKVTDLMVGKVLPYALVGLFDMLLTLAMMVSFFAIPVSGSFWFLCGASTIFILTSLALGLLISTICYSQVQAIQLTMGLLLPSLMLSGFVFPLEPMPWAIKAVSYCLPLTYYLDIIRGVVIKGVGFNDLWQPTLCLTLIGSILLGLSILRFRKQLA